MSTNRITVIHFQNPAYQHITDIEIIMIYDKDDYIVELNKAKDYLGKKVYYKSEFRGGAVGVSTHLNKRMILSDGEDKCMTMTRKQIDRLIKKLDLLK